jgi:hypothetical protein
MLANTPGWPALAVATRATSGCVARVHEAPGRQRSSRPTFAGPVACVWCRGLHRPVFYDGSFTGASTAASGINVTTGTRRRRPVRVRGIAADRCVTSTRRRPPRSAAGAPAPQARRRGTTSRATDGRRSARPRRQGGHEGRWSEVKADARPTRRRKAAQGRGRRQGAQGGQGRERRPGREGRQEAAKEREGGRGGERPTREATGRRRPLPRPEGRGHKAAAGKEEADKAAGGGGGGGGGGGKKGGGGRRTGSSSPVWRATASGLCCYPARAPPSSALETYPRDGSAAGGHAQKPPRPSDVAGRVLASRSGRARAGQA